MPYKDKDKANEWAKNKKRRVRDKFFESNPCMDCGSTDELQLHHRDPSLKIDSNVWLWAKERKESELAKCDVVCYTCHLIRHGKNHVQCGTRACYNAGCRCEECRCAHRAYMRVYMRTYR